MTLLDLKTIIKKWLYMENDTVIDVAIAGYVANHLQDNPIWLLLVAPPSSGKTEIIDLFTNMNDTYLISDLSPKTFISGRGKQASLLHKLEQMKKNILLIKDFTTILSKRSEDRREILAQMREIYDGKFTRQTGGGESVQADWKGKLGLIGGVTEMIDVEQPLSTLLGERFILFRIPANDHYNLLERVDQNFGRRNEMKEEVRGAILNYFATLGNINELDLKIEISKQLQDTMRYLCMFTVRARAPVTREWGTAKNIEHVATPEAPARLYGSVIALAKSLMFMKGETELSDGNYRIISQLILDSIPSKRMKVINYLLQNTELQETSNVALGIKLPSPTTHRTLEELVCFDVVKREKTPDGRDWDLWSLTDEAKLYLSFRPGNILTPPIA